MRITKLASIAAMDVLGLRSRLRSDTWQSFDATCFLAQADSHTGQVATVCARTICLALYDVW